MTILGCFIENQARADGSNFNLNTIFSFYIVDFFKYFPAKQTCHFPSIKVVASQLYISLKVRPPKLEPNFMSCDSCVNMLFQI